WRRHQHPGLDAADHRQVALRAVRIRGGDRDSRFRPRRPDLRSGERDRRLLAPPPQDPPGRGGNGRVGISRAHLDPYARRVWPPLFLCGVVVFTWAMIDSFADPVYTNIAVKMFLMLIIVLGLQIFSGNSGVLSFGHIAFMAVGAYSSALLTIPTAIKQFT